MTIFLKNDQYFLKINNKKNKVTHLLSHLSQKDSRIKAHESNKFPFVEEINPNILILMKINDNKKITKFKIEKLLGKTNINYYRDISLEKKLENGNYIIIPCTKTTELYGDYFLNIYFDCENGEINFKCLTDESKKYEIIEEEDEEIKNFDESFKKALKENTKYIIHSNNLNLN